MIAPERYYVHQASYGLLDLGDEIREKTEQCESRFTKPGAVSPLAFSEELSEDKKNELAALGFDLPNVRLMTAESVMRRLKQLGFKRADFFTNLLSKTEETSRLLMEEYEKLIKKSRFFYSGKLFWEDEYIGEFSLPIVERTYERDVAELIKKVLPFNSVRQALIVFLAAHEYTNESFGTDDGLFFALNNEPSKAAYPCFNINLNQKFIYLTPFGSKGTLSTFGFRETEGDIADVMVHEFGHGIQSMLGFHHSKAGDFAVHYLNPFTRELLFPDCDSVSERLKERISGIWCNLSEIEKKSFRDSMIKHFCLPGFSEGASINIRKTESETCENDGYAFAEEIIRELTLCYTEIVWSAALEIHNIIGLGLEEDTVFVSTFSDLDSLLEQGKQARWTHMDGNKNVNDERILCTKSFHLDLCDTKDINTLSFVDWFYETLFSEAPLNHPPSRALRALEILHGKTELTGE
jgi:hypothetical protein